MFENDSLDPAYVELMLARALNLMLEQFMLTLLLVLGALLLIAALVALYERVQEPRPTASRVPARTPVIQLAARRSPARPGLPKHQTSR